MNETEDGFGVGGLRVEFCAVIRRLLATACCVAVIGCSGAAPEATTPAAVPSAAAAAAPEGGVLLSDLGYNFAPAGFSVPDESMITERVDQENTVVAVFTSPSGPDVAAYLRMTLPDQGWEITADGNGSLLFERGEEYGAFTVTGDYAALSLRWDARS